MGFGAIKALMFLVSLECLKEHKKGNNSMPCSSVFDYASLPASLCNPSETFVRIL